MADGNFGAGATGELSGDEAGGSPRPLKRWHVLVVGRTATTVEESPDEELAPERRRDSALGQERPAAAGG